MNFVICREDRQDSGEPGTYTVATRVIFATRGEAESYAKGVSTSREPIVVEGARRLNPTPSWAKEDVPLIPSDLAHIAEYIRDLRTRELLELDIIGLGPLAKSSYRQAMSYLEMASIMLSRASVEEARDMRGS